MFCPHCGAENKEGDRYCVNCGSDLPRDAGKPAGEAAAISWRQRVDRIIGTTRRARVLTGVTAAAILLAVIAFVALKPAEDGPEEDAYTRKLDKSCVTEKQTIAALEQQTAQQGSGDLATFAGALVTIVEEWRSSLRENPAPAAHAEAVQSLDSALLEVLIKAGALARVARAGGATEVTASARAVDEASALVEQAVTNLGLSQCSDLSVGVQPAASH
jgi:anaerobic C4-dicarboxylate transporter